MNVQIAWLIAQLVLMLQSVLFASLVIIITVTNAVFAQNQIANLVQTTPVSNANQPTIF